MIVKNLCTTQSESCPGDNGHNYECLECNESTSECSCVKMDPDHEGHVYCHHCNDTREFDIFDTNIDFGAIQAQLIDDDDIESYQHYVDIADYTQQYGPDDYNSAETAASVFMGKCRHRNFPVKFPDGTTVFASSQHRRNTDNTPAPDLALYLDWSWNPTGPAYYLDWRDYGLPTTWEAAAKTIIEVFQRAQENLWVEVGCIGGHGRTGTALAAMAVLGGVPANGAVEWVKTNYCEHAVETDLQGWWVEWFAAWVNGTDCPDYPRYNSATKTTEWIGIDSYEGAGHDLNDAEFHALWIEAHTTEGVDTSQEIIQQQGGGSFYEADVVAKDYSNEAEWRELMYAVPNSEHETTFPIHFLTDRGEQMVMDLLASLDQRTLEYIARYYYSNEEKIHSFGTIQKELTVYDGHDPETIDRLLEMDLSDFIKFLKVNDEEEDYGAMSLSLGNKIMTLIYETTEDELEQAENVLDSLAAEAEEWLSEHLNEDFTLAELIQGVIEFERQANSF